MIKFEDWLVGQTSAPRPRSTLAQLMLDRRFAEVDLGSQRNRDAVRLLLDDFERDAEGQWVRSDPLPSRAGAEPSRPPSHR
ncbi:MAG: hypothetical protein QOI36_2371 [Pseudonocardiales bacterium]|nr:hypothetical protein [Pseudonocardia sp.]MDT7650965.1 hypothetical protein [Pseudonocardiales bacterium]